MAAVQSVPDDEIAAELAGAWPDDPDALDGRDPPTGHREPAGGARVSPGPRPARRPGDPRDLRQAAARVRPVSWAGEQQLPLLPALAGLLPAGLRRGSAVAVGAAVGGRGAPGRSGATALALALAAGPSVAGSWVAAVGLPELGLVAAAELGVALDRLVIIGVPPPEQWPTVVGALVGAFDLVLVAAAGRLRPAESRRLAARARERGSVLVQVEVPGEVPVGNRSGRGRLGLDVDVRLSVTDSRWDGVGEGHGHLQGRRAVVRAEGRRQAARPRQIELWLPDDQGQVRECPAPVEVAVGPAPARGRPAGQEPFGSRVDELVAARQGHLRRAVRRPLPPTSAAASGTAGGPAEWSDAR